MELAAVGAQVHGRSTSRWSRHPGLERIADYLFGHTPDHAERLVRTLYDAPATLLTFPNRGRPGKKEGTRELVMSPLPYILVYTVRGGAVYVRILNGAQQWP